LIEKYQPLPIAGCAPAQAVQRLRLNSFGSLYYFSKNVLKRRKLTNSLHKNICDSLESEKIKDVYEIPRDHYKTTLCTESLPMWWALPFMDYDAQALSAIGYSDEFIKWMQRCHRPEVRNLLVSENITNASKLGSRIRYHFESNDVYRSSFPETLPDTSCVWTNYSLHVKMPPGHGSGHGEGTFDFLGVGGALQSRHYDKAIEDDLVGRKAIESQAIMDKTIEYHKLIIGAFESQGANKDNDEIVVGNRWSFHDLNSHIREHEDGWNFHTHSALGGCCSLHPADTPIFPEEFSFDKLMRIKQRQGTYIFSCQYLNNPAAPDNAAFKAEWLRHFEIKEDVNGKFLSHEVKDGEVVRDTRVNFLRITMTVDPAHSTSSGPDRCRHAIIVLGLAASGNYYLLEAWAETCGFDKFIAKIYELATKWKLRKFGLETVAAQKFLMYHINFINRLEDRQLSIVELKGEVELEDGEISRKKEWRVRNVLEPIFESGRFFVQRKHQDFLGEYTSFPRGRFVDLLDALAYAPQMITLPQRNDIVMRMKAQNAKQLSLVNRPYAAGN
jgi:hypothetical protein